MAKNRYIGEKEILAIVDTEKKLPSGTPIMEVQYQDGSKEQFSSIMLDKIVSSETCNLTELRERRLVPVVQETLRLWLDWGVKMSELHYLSTLLAQSLAENQKQALLSFWKQYGPDLLDPDDVDMITVDQVLRGIGNDEGS